MMADQLLRGSCLCGAVTYQVQGPFLRFAHCHCPRCCKATGTGHATIFTSGPSVSLNQWRRVHLALRSCRRGQLRDHLLPNLRRAAAVSHSQRSRDRGACRFAERPARDAAAGPNFPELTPRLDLLRRWAGNVRGVFGLVVTACPDLHRSVDLSSTTNLGYRCHVGRTTPRARRDRSPRPGGRGSARRPATSLLSHRIGEPTPAPRSRSPMYRYAAID